jgi:hypothetical protein
MITAMLNGGVSWMTDMLTRYLGLLRVRPIMAQP